MRPSFPHSPATLCWSTAIGRLAAILQTGALHPTQVVVLLPYAQLLPQARQAWAQYGAQNSGSTVFMPRFETTQTWAARLAPATFTQDHHSNDISGDSALDLPRAAALLAQAGLADEKNLLTPPLVETAWSLMAGAAAQQPAQRLVWGASCAAELSGQGVSPVFAYEAALARIALAWAASSSYDSDVLFDTPVQQAVVLQGFQPDPLQAALMAHWGSRVQVLPLYEAGAQTNHVPPCSLHCASDAQDEAERAAACVLRHLEAGRSPVALVAQDRQLTRRISALLTSHQISIHDETGWKLSTARLAGNLMALLGAVPEQALTDAVLDWLKSSCAFDASQINALEAITRQHTIRCWSALTDFLKTTAALAAAPKSDLIEQVAALQTPLREPRTLWQWLQDLRQVLQAAGQWESLQSDHAGQALLKALRLPEGAAAALQEGPVITLAEFSRWVQGVLEAGSFSPASADAAQVIVLPLPQLLGRHWGAVVWPGCDDMHLPASPQPPGPWTEAERALLGMPGRQALAQTMRQAWQYALQQPHLDVLWRTSEAGETVPASGLVQTLLLESEARHWAADPRQGRPVAVRPSSRPQPTAPSLVVKRLSASVYEDLRRCPYRFFALRQLQLQAPQELDSTVGKRDFGNWLHQLLHCFHDLLKQAPTQDLSAQLAMINIAAERAMQALQLTPSEFLPFAAAWPAVRQGYLDWWAQHQASGARFEAAEAWRDMPLGELTLLGKLDRIDRQADGSALVIDYKTEPRSTTASRIKAGQEDTQLAFYAALLADDTLEAAYVNVGEKEGTQSYPQPDIVNLRDGLVDSILHDMRAIEQGAALPALGEGKVCDYCEARGLCRKDFWS